MHTGGGRGAGGRVREEGGMKSSKIGKEDVFLNYLNVTISITSNN
jgi:hypothetical protein